MKAVPLLLLSIGSFGTFVSNAAAQNIDYVSTLGSFDSTLTASLRYSVAAVTRTATVSSDVTGFARLTVNPTNETVAFSEINLNTVAMSFQDILPITSGFGQVQNYTISLNFQPVSFWLSDGPETHGLTPLLNGDYALQNASTLAASNLALLGTYSVAGPTETLTGSFIKLPSGLGALQLPETFHTMGYPEVLSFSDSEISGAFPFQGVFQDIFSLVVDGRTVEMDLTDVSYRALFSSFTPIPEPSTYALLAGLAVFGGVVWRKRAMLQAS